MILEEEEKEFVPYKCDSCSNLGLRQFCYEHKKHHGHGMVHLNNRKEKLAYWLCNACSEREQ